MAPIDENDRYDPVAGRPTLILGGHDFHSITEAVARPVLHERKNQQLRAPLLQLPIENW